MMIMFGGGGGRKKGPEQNVTRRPEAFTRYVLVLGRCKH